MNTDLGPLLYSFFEDYLKCQKGLRPGSLKSYRDSLRLFLLYLTEKTGRKISRLTLADLTSLRCSPSFRIWKATVTTKCAPAISGWPPAKASGSKVCRAKPAGPRHSAEAFRNAQPKRRRQSGQWTGSWRDLAPPFCLTVQGFFDGPRMQLHIKSLPHLSSQFSRPRFRLRCS